MVVLIENGSWSRSSVFRTAFKLRPDGQQQLMTEMGKRRFQRGNSVSKAQWEERARQETNQKINNAAGMKKKEAES